VPPGFVGVKSIEPPKASKSIINDKTAAISTGTKSGIYFI